MLKAPFDAVPPGTLLELRLTQTRGEIVGVPIITGRILRFIQRGFSTRAGFEPGEVVLEIHQITRVRHLLLAR